MTTPSPSTWLPRDYPVLVAIAPLIDTDLSGSVKSQALAEQTGLSHNDVLSALVALAPAYVEIKEDRRANWLKSSTVTALTERGRRSAGLWPSQEDHLASLIASLRSAADEATDEKDRTLLKRIGTGLAAAPGTIASGVVTAWLSSQIG